jgi:FkbM family methyltransferase
VCSFIPVAWAHPDGLLPHYAVDVPQRVLEQAGAVREAYALFEDERSRREFRAQLAWRLTADFSLLADHLPTSEQYFSRDVLELRADDVFVDCGAFDGDTIQSLMAHRPDGVARIVALEPDPENLRALDARLDALGADVRERVSVLPWAAGARRGVARWGLPGTSSAGIDSAGELEVEVAPLDELLERGITPSYVKMDIEGAEPDALQGASQIVTRHRPTLAICVYHAQDHLWRLPLAVAALVDNYRFVLRRYESDCWEVVLYAIPRERAGADALAR